MAIILQKGDLSPDDFDNDNTNNMGGVTLKNVRPCQMPAATPAQIAALDAGSLLSVCVEAPAGTFSNVSITFQQLADALVPLMTTAVPLLSTFGAPTGVNIAPALTSTETDEVFNAFGVSIGFVAPSTLADAFGVAIN